MQHKVFEITWVPGHNPASPGRFMIHDSAKASTNFGAFGVYDGLKMVAKLAREGHCLVMKSGEYEQVICHRSNLT